MELQTVKQRFGIIGNSPALNYALSVAVRVAPTNLSVLINGESGVGKEIFSQILHQLSPRKHNPFIAVNCGAIPEGTIDSELFGHEKGSFTGANDKRKGYFETVDGGTIFLDEIGEMPIGTQARLLRVLESGEFIKVGSSASQKTDVRVVAATNVNLLESVQKGKFREDLYYRLSTVPIEIPPLRDRGDDIILLFRKLCSDFSEKTKIPTIQLDEEAKQLLLKYNWPGNVRQLKNIAEQVSVLAKDKNVGAEEFIHFIPDFKVSKTPALMDYKDQQQQSTGGANNFSERELLYKMLFDIKKDINDLKQFMLNMNVAPMANNPYVQENINSTNYYSPPVMVHNDMPIHSNVSQPIVINDKNNFTNTETIDESLSLDDKEKEMILRALKKHKSRRKKAADDLGISERTLYRKIKEYGIDE
ncbi:MAG: sigma-54 dependent transcriptional regulator [Bacteroidota bacterium]